MGRDKKRQDVTFLLAEQQVTCSVAPSHARGQRYKETRQPFSAGAFDTRDKGLVLVQLQIGGTLANPLRKPTALFPPVNREKGLV